MPYLVAYPPDHWSLNRLGENLPRWLAENYSGNDKQLLLDSSRIDLAYTQSFLAATLAPLNVADSSKNGDFATLLSKKLYLQPSIFLFQLAYDLFAFRREFLKEEPDYWIENDFPSLEQGEKNFLLCRNPHNDVVWTEISLGEYLLLNYFQRGATFDEACQFLEQQEESIFEDVAKNMQRWSQKWVARGWLSLQRS